MPVVIKVFLHSFLVILTTNGHVYPLESSCVNKFFQFTHQILGGNSNPENHNYMQIITSFAYFFTYDYVFIFLHNVLSPSLTKKN